VTNVKITKSQLKQIIKEEIEQALKTEQEDMDLQNLEPLADKIVATAMTEIEKAGSQATLLMQLVLGKIAEEKPETTEPEVTVNLGKDPNYDAIQAALGKGGEE
jgi:hypothetical protein